MAVSLSERIMIQPDETLMLQVTAKEAVADGVATLVLESPDGAELPAWEPGAHIDVVIGEGVVRQYSLCGDPADRKRWRIGVLREPESRGGSQYIHEMVECERVLEVRGPRNNFSLDASKEYIFIAGGIGVTPILPMIRQAAASGAEFTVLYGGRSLKTMAFVDELKELAGDNLVLRPEDEYGILDLPSYLGAPQADTHVYACGPARLLDAIGENMESWPKGSLTIERFAPSERREGADEPFIVELARSGKRITVPKYESMLDKLYEAGCDVISSCTAGICGTCLVPVLSGVPEHRDDILDDEEQASNKMMLPCVSRAKTDIIVIDL